ncbi:L-aminoadipate-semialdehyde dehydrogenase-phosphopantetheinyl transferase [Grifola frondosa]|uniref:holo-[acyl-carrier-protein] synthase n=1 Tax=Grifola frondosa TaxID=5627 RepID=A0A1C7MJI4_GRIFR|nr:L-aminoadipate-semialdehyde dehydrogenase-phosphopantetheinyl transferase [Grifola frondosa]
MQVWAVTFDVSHVADLEDVYQRGLGILDPDSQHRLGRFYHRVDGFRGLIGKLLPRLLLRERGIAVSSMTFGLTQTGKPYVTTPGLNPSIGYNITHDSGMIAMAYASGDDLYPDPPAYRIGVDVMKLQLPKRDTFHGFVNTVGDQLTDLEREILISNAQPILELEALRRFYLIWTLKEAYTKALGLGLGFDFKRIEYDVPRDVVKIDGMVPRGWKFARFELQNECGGEQTETYVGVAAQYLGDEVQPQGECVVEHRLAGPWLKVFDAAQFIEKAILELK